MSRYTIAYSSLGFRLKEVKLLQQSAALKEKNDPIGVWDEINAFCRAALVLLSAHIEAYIKEVGEVALTQIDTKATIRSHFAPQLYYHISKDRLDEIRDTAEPEKIANKLFTFLNTDLPYWGRNGPFPLPLPADRFNKGFSNPAFGKICSYFNRFGYSDYKRDLARLLAGQYTATVNMVNHIVDTRNKIAHGDLTATKTPTDLRDMISIVRTYCKATDEVFAVWCKKNLCSIR